MAVFMGPGFRRADEKGLCMAPKVSACEPSRDDGMKQVKFSTAVAVIGVLMTGIETAPWASALVLKALAGGVVALIVTPRALRALPNPVPG